MGTDKKRWDGQKKMERTPKLVTEYNFNMTDKIAGRMDILGRKYLSKYDRHQPTFLICTIKVRLKIKRNIAIQ